MSARGFGPWGMGPSPWGPPPGPGGFDRWHVWRNPERGWIAGVCAGIADYIGVDPAIVRIVAVISLFFFVVPALVAYVALAIVLKPRPAELFGSSEEEGFWRDLRSRPQTTLDMTASKFRDLDRRLAEMEAAVTSRDFDLHRGFRDLSR